MGWIKFESFGFVCPCFTDELVRCQALQSFETPGKIVGIQEVGQVGFELIMADIMEALYSLLLNRAVHPFNLPVCPGVSWLGQAMFDVIPGASDIKGMASEKFLFLKHVPDFADAPSIAPGIGEMGPVIGQDSMDFIGNRFDELPEKIGGNPACCFFM